jgi:alginate O-acetyltransferase complex protein AlgI
MLFNSIDFALFFPIVFVLYWFVTHKNIKLQNLLIVLASYIFYGWWDWKFLSLILFSTLIDYLIGIGLQKQVNVNNRKILLFTSIFINLGFLGVFKYYNFFIDNFISAFTYFGANIKPNTLSIILPVGISFYTFQTLSYSIDVYKNKIQPTNDFIAFSAFVCFFPQLVAGPIERASNLLPQFYKKRFFDYSKAVDGMQLILWGLFKKVVIADNCAQFANIIFNDYSNFSGSTLLLGTIFFSFQIYGDFSGYSDIAIGTSKLLGFNLSKNFNFPYFSKTIPEFWKRWHISLSSWFKDYVYIPLGGSKNGLYKHIRNTFIIFTVSGFWHGANWTFVIWGLLNAIYFLPSLFFKRKDINYQNNLYLKIKNNLSILTTYILILFSWIFFRSNHISDAFNFIKIIFSDSLFIIPKFNDSQRAIPIILLLLCFISMEWIAKKYDHVLQILNSKSKLFRWSFYYILVITIFIFAGSTQQFIYFQF